MKTAKYLLPLLVVILMAFGIGCGHMDKTDVEKVITEELDLLRNLDSETTQKYISYQDLFPGAAENTVLSDEIQEVFSLFFQDFDYKILDINVDKKEKAATASLRLTTMDAKKLAKDFAIAQLEAEILAAAENHSQNTEETITSLTERYLILNGLLKNNKYETIETECVMQLQDIGEKDEEWEIKRTYSLENDLVGGLMTYLSDSGILSPEETLTVYLNTLKKMNLEEMSSYLGVESILNTSDSTRNSIAAALVEQVHSLFNFKISDSSVDSYKASVTAEITTFDSDAILSGYQTELDKYLESPDAVIDGSQKRYQTSLNLLLSHIEDNTAVRNVSTTFHLINDGASWKLEDSSQPLGSAIFGTLSTTPVEE